MPAITNEIVEIPAALPIAENEDVREQLLNQSDAEISATDDAFNNEIDHDEDFDEIETLPKPSKRKLLFAFVCFVFCFVILAVGVGWFFGIGVFSGAKAQVVDRSAKSGSSQPAPQTEDEKLKMALDLVAQKNPNGQGNSSTSDSSGLATDDPNFNSSVDVSSAKATHLIEPVIVPDSNSEIDQYPNTSRGRANRVESMESPLTIGGEVTSGDSGKTNPFNNQPIRLDELVPIGRSLFFGLERREPNSTKTLSLLKDKPIAKIQENMSSQPITIQIPFGTLLPIRLLGAVYTFRSSGGLVRMELTRRISGKDYSFPAGTVLVGSVRGSEYKRAFISIAGLIDPASGGLIKFEGEAMGNDGASGLIGKRRQVKGIWTRVLNGFREAGGIAIGAIGNRRSGGTVIISDSASKASSTLSEELLGLTGNQRNSGEFIEISAGTTGFVLVTNLPDEISKTTKLGQNLRSASGLDDDELADIFSSGSNEKIRAALPRMTPAFRELAENVLASTEGK